MGSTQLAETLVNVPPDAAYPDQFVDVAFVSGRAAAGRAAPGAAGPTCTPGRISRAAGRTRPAVPGLAGRGAAAAAVAQASELASRTAPVPS
ncbi:MAG: hypothetical protein ACM32E_18250 [Gemmatimonadota bacterium]